jgi:NAD(P)-dependent dehydrogenase (short-subunit alcohol dehydrogenase family)
MSWSARSIVRTVVREIKGAGGSAIAVAGTVGDDDARRLVEAAVPSCARVDIMVNSAGIPAGGQTASWCGMGRRPAWRRSWTFTSVAPQLNRAAWPHMVTQKCGRILFTSSANAIRFKRGADGYEVDYAAARRRFLPSRARRPQPASSTTSGPTP